MKPDEKNKVMRQLAECFDYSMSVSMTLKDIREKVPEVTLEQMLELVEGDYVSASYPVPRPPEYMLKNKFFEYLAQESSEKESHRTDIISLVIALLSLIVAVVSILMQFV